MLFVGLFHNGEGCHFTQNFLLPNQVLFEPNSWADTKVLVDNILLAGSSSFILLVTI